ncbi:hypothetical protein ACIRBX_36030 [Kitasatospora sp. NPDC096147]|uniref:hypothetical protein n=1 Tax=Kitasatospora sp. NPDC096147 TaxID=3364093 RepID=UPI003806B1D4
MQPPVTRHPSTVLSALAGRPTLPEWAADRLLRSRDHDVLRALAVNPGLPPEARLRLADHQDGHVRSGLLRSEDGRTAELYGRFAADPDPEVRIALARCSRAPARVLAGLAHDPDPRVRGTLAQWWTRAPEAVRRSLLTDADATVRAAACAVRHSRPPSPVPPADLHGALLADPPTRAGVVRHLTLSPGLATALAADTDSEVRAQLAAHPDLPVPLRDRLAEDPSALVRQEVLLRRDCPESLRTEIHAGLRACADALFDPGAADEQAERAVEAMLTLADLELRPVPWVLDAPALGVGSPYPCFRVTAAHSPYLTADQRARLLDDPVPHVRLAAAHGIDPDTAERLERGHPARDKVRGRPADGVDFPTTTLRRFATDPDPWIRRLAPRDPQLPAALLGDLAGDGHRVVRTAVAAHARLPVAALLALLADPESSVAGAAARSPSLPTDLMDTLLTAGGL